MASTTVGRLWCRVCHYPVEPDQALVVWHRADPARAWAIHAPREEGSRECWMRVGTREFYGIAALDALPDGVALDGD